MIGFDEDVQITGETGRTMEREGVATDDQIANAMIVE
jgi:hypothetical protein